MKETDQEEIPRRVVLSVNRDALDKNLDSCGMHHVIGEDGTHVVIKDSEGKPSRVHSEPLIRIVKDEPDTITEKILMLFQ